jgi:rod shape-determining protein MreC
MYGIIEFFKRNYFVLLFAALETLALSFVFRDNYYHQAGFFNSANSISGSVYQSYSNITSYFNLATLKTQLAEENVRLHNELSHVADTTKAHKAHLNTNYGQQYDYILAEVIDNSTNRPDNYITLNTGRDKGVTEGMGVIGPKGIVGIVISVSQHYAVVMSFLHKNCKISAMLKKDGTFGTLSWQQSDYRHGLLTEIPMSEQLKAGDSVVTSGYSTVFPKGVPVGSVEYYKPIPDQYFYSISLRLSTNFKDLDYVYVVSNVMKKEKADLEESSTKKENE